MKEFFKRYNFVNISIIAGLALFWFFLFLLLSKPSSIVFVVLSKVALVCSIICWLVILLAIFYIIASEIELKRNPDFED